MEDDVQIEKRPFSVQDLLTIGLLLSSLGMCWIMYRGASDVSIAAIQKEAATKQEVLDAIRHNQEMQAARDAEMAARAEQFRKETEARAAEIRNDLMMERSERSAQAQHNEEKHDATDRLLFDAVQRLNGQIDQLNQRLRGHSELTVPDFATR